MQQNVSFPYNKNDVQFPTNLFVNIALECLDHLPEDIDGMKIFKINCLCTEWVKRTHDLRYFRMQSSRRKGLIGTKKVGRCLGNHYCPYDECPFKFSADGEKNTSNIQNIEGHKTCFSCGHHANRQWCGEQKIMEYCRQLEILTVYHLGTHTCPAKPKQKI